MREGWGTGHGAPHPGPVPLSCLWHQIPQCPASRASRTRPSPQPPPGSTLLSHTRASRPRPTLARLSPSTRRTARSPVKSVSVPGPACVCAPPGPFSGPVSSHCASGLCISILSPSRVPRLAGTLRIIHCRLLTAGGTFVPGDGAWPLGRSGSPHGMSPTPPTAPSVCPSAAATLYGTPTCARSTLPGRHTWILPVVFTRVWACSVRQHLPSGASGTSDLPCLEPRTLESSHNEINPVKHFVLMTVAADNLLGSREGVQGREAQTPPPPPATRSRVCACVCALYLLSPTVTALNVASIPVLSPRVRPLPT